MRSFKINISIYYIVTAVTAAGESANSNEVSATPIASGKTSLAVTLSDQIQKEYGIYEVINDEGPFFSRCWGWALFIFKIFNY